MPILATYKTWLGSSCNPRTEFSDCYLNQKDKLQKAYHNSLLVLGAYKQEELVGIIRVVGDGATIIFIQDLLVKKEEQGAGIGSKLVQYVVERYKDVRQIELTTDNNHELISFYESLGFKKMEDFGCVSFIYLSKGN